MRYVFCRSTWRLMMCLLATTLLFHLANAQQAGPSVSPEGKSMKELPEGAADDLAKAGDRDSHQGADNPMQGNRSGASGRFGGPDPYGPEGYSEFIQEAETKLNDPQWQLKIDLHNPKRIVVNHPDGTAREYWYVLFRVINDNTRKVKDAQLPELHGEAVNVNNPGGPLEVRDDDTGQYEGVPAEAHLDIELHTFTRDMERGPWDTAWPEDPEDEVLSPEGREQRRANMKREYKPVSDQYVLQRIAAAEGLYESMGNRDFINEQIMLLHPLSDFQRQIGLARELDTPDYSGPRCLGYRTAVVMDGEITEGMRYVAVYPDNTYAGIFGPEDPLPEGARLVSDPSDSMWGKLTVQRYKAGDCIDQFGRVLRPNDPGYLQARIAGGTAGESSYGVLSADHPAVNTPVRGPAVRLYEEGDRVLFDHDTGRAHREFPNSTYRLNGKIVGLGDASYDSGQEIDSSTRMFGGQVVGKPVKQIDSLGRAIRRYIVTYQAGDVLTQAEWDIYSRRLGPGVLARYEGIDDIVGRPLRADDPVVGMPRIKLGYFIGEASNRERESISRGIDTGRRGPNGEVILDAVEGYQTGRYYDARRIGPDDFMRDPDGEFTTNRVAPLPDNHGLRPGEDYIYAPLGAAGNDAVPVPRFDRYGAWMDYTDELSGARIPLYDAEGELVRDMQDQLLYLKEYEYEYIYMYEYAGTAQDDEGFRARHGGERFALVQEEIEFAIANRVVRIAGADGTVQEQTVQVTLPLTRLVYKTEDVSSPVVVDRFQHIDDDGTVSLLSKEEYEAKTGAAPGPDALKVAVISSTTEKHRVVAGTYAEGRELGPNETAETWEEARARVTAEGGTIERRPVIKYVRRFLDENAASPDGRLTGTGPRGDEYEEMPVQDNGADISKLKKTWSRWTVPPPMVYQDANGQWQVITRFADKIGPGTRHDDRDAPRFLTRYVSEMWGAAIFENVDRDWDYANVYVRGLRRHVSSAGLKKDEIFTQLPSPMDGTTMENRSFFKPRLVGQEWVYRTRYERLGDEFENFRDLVRRTRTFWYLETEGDRAEQELDN